MTSCPGYSDQYEPLVDQMMPQSTSGTNFPNTVDYLNKPYDSAIVNRHPTSDREKLQRMETPDTQRRPQAKNGRRRKATNAAHEVQKSDHLSAILYHIERIEKHSELLSLWTLMKLGMKENQKSTVVQNEVRKMSMKAVADFSCSELPIPLSSLSSEDQKKTELYCLGLIKAYKLGLKKKDQENILETISEDKLKIMREKEYNHFRVHAAGMKASAQQSEKVSTAKDKKRFKVREDLEPLPENRNDKIFDKYIPLAYLVAVLKQQSEAKNSNYGEGQGLLKANDQKLVELFSKIYDRLNDLQKKSDSTDQLVNLISRGKQFLSTLKNVKNKKEPVIIELKKAIAKRVEADMPGKIADAKLKENRDPTLTEIKKIKSNHAGTIRFRCVRKLLECTYSVYYHHAKAILDHIELLLHPDILEGTKTGELIQEQIGKVRPSSEASLLSRKRSEMCCSSYDVFYEHGRQVRDHIKSIEVSYPPAKRQQVEVPVEDISAEYETQNLQRSNTKLENLDRCLDILEDLENKLKSTDDQFPLTYDLLSNILYKDVHRLLEYFVMDLNFTVDAAVQELTGAAKIAPPVNSFRSNLILSALKDRYFVENFIFGPLDTMRKSCRAPGYAEMQADPEEPKENTTVCQTLQETSNETNHCLQEDVNAEDHIFDPLDIMRRSSSAIMQADAEESGSGNDYGNATNVQETSNETNQCLQEEDVTAEVSGNPSEWLLTDAEVQVHIVNKTSRSPPPVNLLLDFDDEPVENNKK